MKSAFLLIAVILIVLSQPALAVDILFFYETGCPHCSQINDFLNKRIKDNYRVTIRKYDIHQSGNSNLMLDLARAFKAEDILEKGTPAIFIADSAFQGNNRVIRRKIEQAVRAAIKSNAPSALNRLHLLKQDEKLLRKLTLSAVVSAAIVDAINPCACAVLVLLLGTILLASKRKQGAVLGAGFAFSAACYLSYFLMGLGLFKAIQIAGIQRIITIAVAFLAVFIGLWNMKDCLWPGRWFSIEVPKSWQPLLKRITSNITSIPGAFGMGIIISLFLLPCTSGPYIVIIGMLSNVATRSQAVWWLLLYNAIFVLPFVAITLAVGIGFTTTARVEAWRQHRLAGFHFFTGIVMFILGITMLVLVVWGII